MNSSISEMTNVIFITIFFIIPHFLQEQARYIVQSIDSNQDFRRF